jgi:SH3-like domain-containing protein
MMTKILIKMLIKLIYIPSLLLIIFTNNLCFATDNPIFNNYFASVKSGEVNARIGPNIRYPIKWIFVKKNEPVEVIASFDQWKKIRDFRGDEGWISSKMLSNKRYVIIIGTKNVYLYKKSDKSTKVLAYIEPETRLKLIECSNELCMVEVNKIKGWIDRKNLWGVYQSEYLK